MKREGLLYVISAPSGAGKTTLCNAIIDLFSELGQSISFTTRPIRAGEVDGVDYYFVTQDVFKQMIAAEELVEWAQVHGNYYGTALKTLTDARSNGRDVLLDIDFQGALQLKKLDLNVVFIFIAPPSFAVLENRLRGRGTDSAEVISRRIENAAVEMAQARWYDYIIVNGELDQAIAELKAVISAQRCRGDMVFPWIEQQFNVE
ncbi:MAG: guanylate kinase [Desulfobacteraceae bacterium 4572_35.1]|nr:MAG: guanylate kinase [Desulfobacteraceae bacterium 4572_35.1]